MKVWPRAEFLKFVPGLEFLDLTSPLQFYRFIIGQFESRFGDGELRLSDVISIPSSSHKKLSTKVTDKQNLERSIHEVLGIQSLDVLSYFEHLYPKTIWKLHRAIDRRK